MGWIDTFLEGFPTPCMTPFPGQVTATAACGHDTVSSIGAVLIMVLVAFIFVRALIG